MEFSIKCEHSEVKTKPFNKSLVVLVLKKILKVWRYIFRSCHHQKFDIVKQYF